jgi:hypothetical protein
MIRLSVRRKIMGIAVALIVLMTITAIMSAVWVIEVGHRLQELTNSYIPAYGNLARTNIRSLERALALRRMVIEKLQSPSSGDKSAVIRNLIDAKSVEVEREARTARALINDLIEKGETLGDETALARLESRIDTAMADTRRELNAEIERLLAALPVMPRRRPIVLNVSTTCVTTSIRSSIQSEPTCWRYSKRTQPRRYRSNARPWSSPRS